MGKLKNIFKPDWQAIIQGLYTNLIWWAVPVTGIVFWIWISKVDPLKLRIQMNRISSILLYYPLMAIGFGTIVFWGIRLCYRIKPPLLLRFSMKLDNMTSGKEITGMSLRFLNNIKSAPPFLGIQNKKMFISINHEQQLTEFFLARIYVEENQDFIRGGKYQIKESFTSRKEIAKDFYGQEDFEYPVEADFLPKGTWIELPYVNLKNLSDKSADIHRKLWVSQNVDNIIGMLRQYNLLEDEGIQLMRWVYDAAQKTLKETRRMKYI